MPRLSARRGLLYAGLAASCTLFVVNLQLLPVARWSTALGGGGGGGAGASVARTRFLSGAAAGAANSSAWREEGALVPHRQVAREAAPVPLPSTEPSSRAWFHTGGRVRPQPTHERRTLAVWPEEDSGDRIVNQLKLAPPPPPADGEQPKLKKILLYEGFGARMRPGQEEFIRSGCPVNTCELTTSRSQMGLADAVLFKDRFTGARGPRRPGQLWIMYLLECPLHTVNFRFGADQFNWTATYRHDSDIVAPYEKWTYYDDAVHFQPQAVNYAANKTKKVAWFVSNCGASNKRLQYAKALAKYIDVDIYGSCGTKKCPRSMAKKCFSLLNSDYKFYLAFENSNCRDYITEKFFVNGLQHNVLPIVMGAHPDDYRRAAPERSYVHVDEFGSPRELAQFLHTLDADDRQYNAYFQWKGTGEFINTYFFCRLCAMLHDRRPAKHVADLNSWWRPPGVCITGRWPVAAAAGGPADAPPDGPGR